MSVEALVELAREHPTQHLVKHIGVGENVEKPRQVVCYRVEERKAHHDEKGQWVLGAQERDLRHLLLLLCGRAVAKLGEFLGEEPDYHEGEHEETEQSVENAECRRNGLVLPLYSNFVLADFAVEDSHRESDNQNDVDEADNVGDNSKPIRLTLYAEVFIDHTIYHFLDVEDIVVGGEIEIKKTQNLLPCVGGVGGSQLVYVRLQFIDGDVQIASRH